MAAEDTVFSYYLRDYDTKFEGWDFSHLRDRMVSFPLAWNYKSCIIPYLLNSSSLLDMGTGGGELLAQLPYPPNTYATEGYTPNIQLAKDRLEPLGISVSEVSDDAILPFADESFDVVINRHEEFLSAEVFRVLAPGGYFITQQVGHQETISINEEFGLQPPEQPTKPIPGGEEQWSAGFVSKDLQDHGFEIIVEKSAEVPLRFYDIGALVYYLKATPWQVPEFTPIRYQDKLYGIHQQIREIGYLDITTGRFLVIARKPSS